MVKAKNSKYFAKLQMIIDITKYSSNYFFKKQKFSISKTQNTENEGINKMRHMEKFSKKKILCLSSSTKNMFYNMFSNISVLILSFLFYFAYICI